MAILALVFAFVFAPAAIVLGIVARKQIRQTGEDGMGLATAGLVCGIVFTAFFVLVMVLWVTLFFSFFNDLPAHLPTGNFAPTPTFAPTR
jgi:Domain of unknown function (DUF4190)